MNKLLLLCCLSISVFGEGKINVPDGSYQAFKLEDGQLSFIDKVFHQVSTEPVRDSTIIINPNRNIDILGRKKGN